MQKAKVLPGFAAQSSPVGTHSFKQAKAANNIGLNKVFRAMDAAINMAFSGKTDEGARLMFGKQTRYQSRISNIAVHENMTPIPVKTF